MNKNSIYIYWRDTGPFLWSRSSQTIEAGFIERESAAEFVGDAHLIIVLPCQHVSLYDVELAARTDQHIRASLPYALEDDLASDIERNHFAYRRTDKGVQAAVVLHEQLQAWLSEIQTLALKPAVLLPEACLLSASDDSLIVHDEGFFMQFPGEMTETLAGELAMLPTWLQFHLSQESAEQNDLLVWDLRQVSREPIVALQDLPHMQVAYRGAVADPGQSFADLLGGHEKKFEINLLQGKYDNSGNLLKSLWQTYRYVIYIGMSAFVIGLIGMWLKADSLESKYRHLNQQAEQVYRSTFPNAKHVEDPKLQMQQQLSRIQDNATARANDFVAMLASVGTVLQRYGKGKIDRMTFQKGKLRIDLVVDSEQDIEKIANQLRQLREIKINRGPVQKSGAVYRANIEMVVKPQ